MPRRAPLTADCVIDAPPPAEAVETAMQRAASERARRIRLTPQPYYASHLDSPAVDDGVRSELAELLAIPSVSADPAHGDDVWAAAEWVRSFVERAGGEAELVDRQGRPLVVGEIRASGG